MQVYAVAQGPSQPDRSRLRVAPVHRSQKIILPLDACRRARWLNKLSQWT